MKITPNNVVVKRPSSVDTIDTVSKTEQIILDFLESPMTVNQLVTRLMHVYEVDRETCFMETKYVLETLVNNHWIVVKRDN